MLGPPSSAALVILRRGRVPLKNARTPYASLRVQAGRERGEKHRINRARGRVRLLSGDGLSGHFLAGVTGKYLATRFDQGVRVVDRHRHLPEADDDQVERILILL